MALRDIKIGAATFSRIPAKSKLDTGFTILGVYEHFKKIDEGDLAKILQLPTKIEIPEGLSLLYSYKYKSPANDKFYVFFIMYLGAGHDKPGRAGAYYGGAVGIEYEGLLPPHNKSAALLKKLLDLSCTLVLQKNIHHRNDQEIRFTERFKKSGINQRVDLSASEIPLLLSSPKMAIKTQEFIKIATEQNVSEKIYYSDSHEVLKLLKEELDESMEREYDSQKGIKSIISVKEDIVSNEGEFEEQSDLPQDEDDVLVLTASEKEHAYVETLDEVLKLNRTINKKIDGIAKILNVNVNQYTMLQAKKRARPIEPSGEGEDVSKKFYNNNSPLKRKSILAILFIIFCVVFWIISGYYHKKNLGAGNEELKLAYQRIEQLKSEASNLNTQLMTIKTREQKRIEKIKHRAFDFDAKHLRIYGLIKSNTTSIPPQFLTKSQMAAMFNVKEETIRDINFKKSNTSWFLIPIKGLHYVEEGETLLDLAQKYYIDTGNSILIRYFNDIKEGESIKEGTLLCIPFEKKIRDS